MNKTDLIKEVSNKSKLTNKDCKNCINAFIEIINDSLMKGKEIKISGLGKFDISTRSARNGVNPKTKEKIIIPTKNVVKFKSYKKID